MRSCAFCGPERHVRAARDYLRRSRNTNSPLALTWSINVLPVCRYRHNNPFGFEAHDNIGCMDLVGASPRPHIDRVLWLLRHANSEYRRRVWEQVAELVSEALLVSERVRGYEDDLTVMLGEGENKP